MPRLFSNVLLLVLIASSGSAVTMDWTIVGNPGNACDPQHDPNSGNPICVGSVGYGYSIGTYEVTNAQYTEFLNAKAASDPLGLYNTSMGLYYGGITRTGSSGTYTYSVTAGRGDAPVDFVSFYDALRFANWLNNGQGSGDTETGAYTLVGGTPTPINGTTVTRTSGASIVLTSENEWYKAAYYDSATQSYFDYPTGSNTLTTCSTPTATANRANCNNVVGNLTSKGSYTGSASRYGTYDQGGNLWEWNETIIEDSLRGLRGGAWVYSPQDLAATFRGRFDPTLESYDTGFRVAMVPEPGTGLLVIAGLLGLAGWRRHRY